jgi:methionine-rich copper-binding protein CopC
MQMKKLLLASFLLTSAASAHAQVIHDTVAMGPQYATNKWYSLENDEVDSSSATNWDIALAATSNTQSSIITALHINPKLVKLYEATGILANPTDFAGVTAFDNTWPQLHNTDTSWSLGAFNVTDPDIGTYDYGWGTYNTTTHIVEANRVFVLEYASSVYRKMYITLNPNPGHEYYLLTHANLDNSNLQTDTIYTAPYDTKNFVYFSLSADSIIDREPASQDWDLLFTQYTDIAMTYTVTGILHNVGVEVLKDTTVANVTTFSNWISPDYSPYINTLGYNWKTLNQQFTYDIEDSTVYFIKAMNGDIWKMVMTGFIGSSAGKFMFWKEKMETAGVANTSGENTASLAIYPNPATANNVSIVYNLNTENKNVRLTVLDINGKVVAAAELDRSKGLHKAGIPDTQNLVPGMYIINLGTDNGSMQQKLIIQ